jgi:hypothetical protein
MTAHPITLALLVLASGAGGYLLRGRSQPPLPRPPPARVTESAAPEVSPAGAAQSRPSGDCRAVQNQLAICTAYHPSEDEKDKQLAMCRGDLNLCRDGHSLPNCYDFIDLAPVYDRELGEVDPSPETLERAKSLTIDECVRVVTWADRARRQQTSCLRGETPPGFKERYGRAIAERALVRACQTDAVRIDVLNAWLRREEDHVREMGRKVTNSIRFGPDGGLVDGQPDP